MTTVAELGGLIQTFREERRLRAALEALAELERASPGALSRLTLATEAEQSAHGIVGATARRRLAEYADWLSTNDPAHAQERLRQVMEEAGRVCARP